MTETEKEKEALFLQFIDCENDPFLLLENKERHFRHAFRVTSDGKLKEVNIACVCHNGHQVSEEDFLQNLTRRQKTGLRKALPPEWRQQLPPETPEEKEARWKKYGFLRLTQR